jgi:hypothetical protein
VIPDKAAIAISDMLEHCARIQPGQEVLILSHIDGLHGGDNLVDPEVISWIQTSVQKYGAHASILWIDEPAKLHSWRFPPVFKAALTVCNMVINHSFNITVEEIMEFRRFIEDRRAKDSYSAQFCYHCTLA